MVFYHCNKCGAELPLIVEKEYPHNCVEYLVYKYGEQYRQLLQSAFDWIEINEPLWGLNSPMDRNEFFGDLVQRAKRNKE